MSSARPTKNTSKASDGREIRTDFELGPELDLGLFLDPNCHKTATKFPSPKYQHLLGFRRVPAGRNARVLAPLS